MHLQVPCRTTLQRLGEVAEKEIGKLCSHSLVSASGNKALATMWIKHIKALLNSSKNSNNDTFVNQNLNNHDNFQRYY